MTFTILFFIPSITRFGLPDLQLTFVLYDKKKSQPRKLIRNKLLVL